ncbi:MAG TPA: efflux RND transporter periplasmic adaptor subunit [Gammaproteobacteria bacterium]|jgi:multidrug efflux system membrane fusion protein
MSNQARWISPFPRFARAVTLLVLAAGAGCSQDSQAPAPTPPEVTVAEVLSREITDWDRYVGRLRAVQEVEVRARVSGYLESVNFREGAIVEQGQLLFVIDPRPNQAALKAAEAEVTVAETRLRLAETQRTRAERLFKSKTIPEEEFDIRTEERREAAAALDAARAALESARLDLEFTQIKAPISGRISRALVTPGNLVSGGTENSTLLTTIVSLDPIHVYVTADEQAYLHYRRMDQEGRRPSSRDVPNPVRLKLSDEESFSHEGVMDFVDNQVDEGTGTMLGRAVFANPDYLLTPGMFAEVELLGEGPYDAVLVPDAAIGNDQARRFVYVVGGNNVAERRYVVPGRLHGNLRVIREGLNPGDRVVINGIQRVRPGEPVTPVPGTIEPPPG